MCHILCHNSRVLHYFNVPPVLNTRHRLYPFIAKLFFEPVRGVSSIVKSIPIVRNGVIRSDRVPCVKTGPRRD